MSWASEFGKVALPVDFRHSQTKQSLPLKACSAQVQQMQLLWQTLEAIPRLLAMWTFNSRLRTDGKDRCVSRQARWAGHEVCPPGFLVGASMPGVVSVFWPVAGGSSPVAYI